MKNAVDPPRLDAPEGNAPEGLKMLIGDERRHLASAEELRRLEGRLGPILDAPMATVSGGLLAGSAKLLLVAAVAVGAAVAGARLWSSRGDRPTVSAATGAHPAPAPAPARMPAPAVDPLPAPAVAPPAAETVVVPVPAETPPPAGPRPEARARRRAADERGAAEVPASPPVAAEEALIGRAQAALSNDPAQALALAAEHARLHPDGVLAQEREVIAIDALVRLGRAEAAAVRAKAFTDRWPGSAHGRRLKQIVPAGKADGVSP